MKRTRYSTFIARHAVLIAVVGTLLAAVGAYFSVLLYENLRTDIEELLPTQARSGKDLKKLTERMQSFDYIAVIVLSQDPAGSRRYVDELATRLKTISPDLAARIEYRIGDEMGFFRRRVGLFLTMPDLLKIRDYVRERIRYEKEMFSPLNIFPVADRFKKPKLDFNSLFSKYSTGGTYDTFPEGYYATPDGKARAILVYMTGKHSDIHRAHLLRAEVDRVIAGLDPKAYAPDIQVAFTGGVESFIEEHAALIADLELSTLVVIVLVTLAMILFYRDIGATLALVTSLFAGTLWTFGISYFLVGYLNANSAFLGSIVIGNGINFGIILLARYVEERRRQVGAVRASARAVHGTLTATLTAALAAGLSYGSLMLTRFRGFQQFGTIGFIGMVLCWISAFTLLPAYLAILERLRHRRGSAPPSRHASRLARFSLDGLASGIAATVHRAYRPIFAVALVATVGSLLMLPRVNRGLIETNLNKLRNKATLETGAGFYDHYLVDIFKQYLTHTVILARSREQAIAVEDRLKDIQRQEGASSLFGAVQSINDFVPPDQAAKIAILKGIRTELTPKIIDALEPKEQTWIRDFLSPDALHPFGEDELPSLVRAKFREIDGSLGKLVIVDPPLGNGSDIAWHGDTLIKFVTQCRQAADAIEPGLPVAGQLPISADMVESILEDGPKATVFAFLAVVILVVFLFRNMATISLALFALIQGVLWLAGIVLFLRLKINFLNFIALPITFGIGVDYGVNIFQRYRLERAVDPELGILNVVRKTGGAVMLASLTTVIGYSSLLIAGNQAFVSFGTLAVLGELTCVAAAVISLPAFILTRHKTGGHGAPVMPMAAAPATVPEESH